MALHRPPTEFQIGPLTWLDLHSLEEPHARPHWKTGPEPTSRTRTPTSLAHTPAQGARLTRPRTRSPQPRCQGGLRGTHCPSCPACTKALQMGPGPRKRAFYPPGKTPEPRAKEQLLTEERRGQVSQSMAAGGTEILLGPERSKHHGSKTDIWFYRILD